MSQLELEYAVKICADCRVLKSVADFPCDRRRPDGLYVYCFACGRRRGREYYLRNRAGESERKARAYRENSAVFRARNNRWRSKNRERELQTNRRYYQENKDRFAAWHKTYYEANKDAALENSRRRRARKRSAVTIAFTPEQLAARWAYYGDKCWVCRGPAEATDHVKPLAKGGAHMLCNLRPICRACNSAKCDRWPLSAFYLLR